MKLFKKFGDHFWHLATKNEQKHSVKSLEIRCFSWPKYRKIRTRKNSVFGHFSRSENKKDCVPSVSTEYNFLATCQNQNNLIYRFREMLLTEGHTHWLHIFHTTAVICMGPANLFFLN